MGEMADYALEQVDEWEEQRSAWRSGTMSVDEALDCGVIDERGDEYGPGYGRDPKARSMICRYCGTSELAWADTANGWRLADSKGRIHACREYKSTSKGADETAQEPGRCAMPGNDTAALERERLQLKIKLLSACFELTDAAKEAHKVAGRAFWSRNDFTDPGRDREIEEAAARQYPAWAAAERRVAEVSRRLEEVEKTLEAIWSGTK